MLKFSLSSLATRTKTDTESKVKKKKKKDRDKNSEALSEKDKGLKDRTTGLGPGAEGYPAWAALPLAFSVLRSSHTTKAEDSAGFSSI